MNKKLFSWKALAGLALLVAMGLTSCKQGTEVDPTDPYATKTPTTPSATSKGSANVTITVVAGTDLLGQYVAWEKTLNTDQKKAILDAKEFTIAINAKGYKLDGVPLQLPAVWANAADKTLNVVFTNGFAETKKTLMIDADKYNAGANVNITLPGGEYDMQFWGSTVRPVIKSEAGVTLKNLSARTSGVEKNSLTIGDGVTVKIIEIFDALNTVSLTNIVKKAGTGNIVAIKLPAGTYTGEDDGTIKSNGLKFTNLEIAAAVTVQGKAWDKTLKLENVHIAGANTLTIGGNIGSIASINGDLDNNKKLQANVKADALVGKLSKVIVNPATAGKVIEIKDGSAIENVEFQGGVKLSGNASAISSVIFSGATEVYFDKSNVNLAFNDVKFPGAITVTGKVENEVTYTYHTYKYSVVGGWKEVADDSSVALNETIASFDGTNFKDAWGNTVNIEADVVRWRDGKKVTTTVPENVTITFDSKTAANNKLDGGAALTKLFGTQNIDPGYVVILDGTTYTWKKSTDTGAGTTSYELRK